MPVAQKQPFLLCLVLSKGFSCISNKSSVIKSFLKNPGEINLNKAHNLVKRNIRTRGISDICRASETSDKLHRLLFSIETLAYLLSINSLPPPPKNISSFVLSRSSLTFRAKNMAGRPFVEN